MSYVFMENSKKTNRAIQFITTAIVFIFSFLVCTVLTSCGKQENNNTPRPSLNSGAVVQVTFGEQTEGDFNISESAGENNNLTITLSSPLQSEALLNFNVVPIGTAENQTDFLVTNPQLTQGEQEEGETPLDPSIIQFKPGEVSKSINIIIVPDQIDEKDEEFLLELNFDGNAKLENKFYKFTIIDDDLSPTVVLDAENHNRAEDGNLSVAIDEESPDLTISLSLFNQQLSSLDIKLGYTIVPNSDQIVFEEDYLAPGELLTSTMDGLIKGELTIPAGESLIKFDFPILQDAIQEDSESITFALTGADNAAIHETRNFITITINDSNNKSSTINHTGIIKCYDENTLNIPCDNVTLPEQDGFYNGNFDFVKINDNGFEINSGATDWSCVFDRNTGLLWEVKKDRFSYTWYNTVSSINGGENGFVGAEGTSTSCDTIPCNTKNYADVLNTSSFQGSSNIGLCGATNWRLPKLKEMLSIMDFNSDNSSVLINDNFFPVFDGIDTGTSANFYWTTTPASIFLDKAWCVFFGKSKLNHVQQCPKKNALPTRLVASCGLLANGRLEC